MEASASAPDPARAAKASDWAVTLHPGSTLNETSITPDAVPACDGEATMRRTPDKEPKKIADFRIPAASVRQRG
ncbi:hypothetical protein GCM10011515_06230 [Tsuneonella deserti]|uniref:Uncharacterized protein n=1 Tax=Tsuneonella deserti TaxID=2035528 RepID=A0ABQ1S1I2_9SPHN|nr:hypothetical protein GCM10011515_06230 [Tsuneonella deserti]